ncbi:MAG: glutamine synthetase family protein [Granulosicoccus sp.]
MSMTGNSMDTDGQLDVLIVDWQGVLRGKRLPGHFREKILAGQSRMPISAQAMDIWGDDCDEITHLGLSSGDPDGFCMPGNNRFHLQPWNKGSRQILCSLYNVDGTPSDFDVRSILQKQVDKLNTRGLFPVVAVELEFYLLDSSTRDSGTPHIPSQLTVAGTPNTLQLYDMRAMDRIESVLTRIRSFAEDMDIPAETQLAEFGPGQFEINLKHQSNPVIAADHAVLFKQLVDRAANELGLLTTFMAKPYSEHGGSGQHVHVSLLDKNGHNVFDQADSSNLQFAIAGALEHLEVTQLLFAPHANSYRRLQPDSFAPVRLDWGFDHRGVALRIPETSGAAARIEHRVAGADANPYLVLSAILGAIATGFDARQTPRSEPLLPGEVPSASFLTHDWLTAIENFEKSSWASELLGSSFHSLYAAIKKHEAQAINCLVTNVELDTYLSRV